MSSFNAIYTNTSANFNHTQNRTTSIFNSGYNVHFLTVASLHEKRAINPFSTRSLEHTQALPVASNANQSNAMSSEAKLIPIQCKAKTQAKAIGTERIFVYYFECTIFHAKTLTSLLLNTVCNLLSCPHIVPRIIREQIKFV